MEPIVTHCNSAAKYNFITVLMDFLILSLLQSILQTIGLSHLPVMSHYHHVQLFHVKTELRLVAQAANQLLHWFDYILMQWFTDRLKLVLISLFAGVDVRRGQHDAHRRRSQCPGHRRQDQSRRTPHHLRQQRRRHPSLDLPAPAHIRRALDCGGGACHMGHDR